MQSLYKILVSIEPRVASSPTVIAAECHQLLDDWVQLSLRKGGMEPVQLKLVDSIDLTSTVPQSRRQELASGALHHSFYWAKSDERDGAIRWLTFADLVSDGDRVDFQLQIGLDAVALSLDGSRTTPSRPRIVSAMLAHPDWTCRVGAQTLSVQPLLVTAGEAEEFCSDVLFSPSRSLPVVVVTPDENGNRQPVDTRRLAERLGGTANVHYCRDRLTTTVLDQLLGRTLAIGPDAIRVFGPGLEPGSGVEGHWHFLGRTIRAKQLTSYQFSEFLFEKLASRALLRFRESPLLARFRELADKERAARLDEIRRRLANDSTTYQQYAEQVDGENRRLTAELDDLRAVSRQQREQIESLRAALEQAQKNIVDLSAQLGGRAELDLAEPSVEATEAPRSVIEIVKAAGSMPGLVVLVSALEAAEDVPITYQFPERVAAALQALSDGAAERARTGRVAKGWKNFFQGLGFDYKAVLSDTTKNTWGDDYTFLYEGKRNLFEEHFTIGSKSANTCLSIHFSTKLRTDKIVVAYVGRHLRNTQT
jgi:hypothetical protein